MPAQDPSVSEKRKPIPACFKCQRVDHLMDKCPYVSEHYKAILKARRNEDLKERFAFRKDNEASTKRHPDSDQMVKLLQSLDEKMDQFG